MNHIYKVIWNKTRACWQVVSELASGYGKAPSAGRRERAGRSKAAAALALILAAVLTAPGAAWAAEGETYGDGRLNQAHSSFGGGDRETFQKFYHPSSTAPEVEQAGGFRFNAVGLKGNVDLMFKSPDYYYHGFPAILMAAYYFNDSYEQQGLGPYNYLKYLNNTNPGKQYNTLIAVIQYPDPAQPGQTITKTYPVDTTGATGSNNYAAIANAVNRDYWYNPVIASQIAEAARDKAAGVAGAAERLTELVNAGLPRFYVSENGDWQNGLLLEMYDYDILGMGYIYGGFELVPSYQPISAESIPSDPDYFTYDTADIPAGAVWRPLDRLETVTPGASGFPESYAVDQFWITPGAGVTGAAVGGQSVTVANPAAGGETEVVTQQTVLTVGQLTIGTGSVIDLSYLNTRGLDPVVSRMAIDGRYPTGYYDEWGNSINRAAWRILFAERATLADGTVFRLGTYGTQVRRDANGNIRPDWADIIRRGEQDQVYITTAATPDGGPATLYIQLGWAPHVGEYSQGRGVAGPETPVLLGILNGAENFTVEGQSSLADGIFSTYEITPEIARSDNYYQDPDDPARYTGSAWYLKSYSYFDTGAVSESGKTAADNVTVLNNLWRSASLGMFPRSGSLHRSSPAGGSQSLASPAGQEQTQDGRENIWAEVLRDQFKSRAAYGRSLSQSYDGIQVGYDKRLNHRIGGGDVYAGLWLSKLSGQSNTASGGGDQDNDGIGIYGSWIGDKGHFMDVALTAAKLKNDYHFQANDGSGAIGRVTGNYSTWGYGLGAKYGYQGKLANGWFWEPSAAFFVGHVDETTYTLSNHLGIRQGGYDTATGRLGLAAGRDISGKGRVYASVAALHEFAGPSRASAFYLDQSRALETAGGQDTWWEFNLGGNIRISPTGVFNLNLSKTTGNSDGNEWRVNGGANWSWDGFTSRSAIVAGKAEPAAAVETPRENPATVIVGHAPEPAVPEAVPALADEVSIDAGEFTDPAADRRADSPDESQPAAVFLDAPGEYTFAPVTVEAARPDWERRLSPGQVSVIYPAQFEGEQKELPDLLDRVPGLFIHRVSGDGHYTVARARGSTAAQVSVYVDGVLMNLTGDAAVNLSAIPVDNVERIEVYRGYVPARFSGSPLGGVINIVTKKPQEVGGSISQGMRSYGGYTGSYQFTAPVGSGSLMATWQRDIWTGDFPFTLQPEGQHGHEYGDVHRRANGYQNENGMIKWQDDRWQAKVAWKKLHEDLPRAVNRLEPGSGASWNSGFTDDYHKGYYDAEQNIDQKEVQLGWRDTRGDLDWGWKLYYLDSQKDYLWSGLYKAIADGVPHSGWNAQPGAFWGKYHSKKWGANLNAVRKMGSSHLLEFNADLSRETMDADGNDWDKPTIWGATRHTRYQTDEAHLTLQDTITLNRAGDFKLTPVLRADRVEMETGYLADQQWKYSGAVALQKQLNENWSVKTTWGTYHRHPNFYEIFGDGATILGLRTASGAESFWESGQQFDFSLNWQGELLQADTDTVLTWFRRAAKNQFILWMPIHANVPGSYMPLDRARVHGLELAHAMKWPRLSLSLAGTWQSSWHSSGYDRTLGGMQSYITNTPEWIGNARLDYLLPGDKLSVFAEYQYTGKDLLGAADDKSASFRKSLSTLDLGFKYAFTPGWRLTSGVNDVFNKGYDLRQSYRTGSSLHHDATLHYPLAGRTYYATMEYSF